MKKWTRRSTFFAVLAAPALLLAAALAPSLAGQDPAPRDSAVPAKPPAAPVRAVTDNYYGIPIADPYRYMENLKDPEVEAWFHQQNDYTRAVLARIAGRDKLLARIKELDASVPARVGNVRRLAGEIYFYTKTLPQENFAKLYTRRGLDGAERLLVDPGRFVKPGGPPFAINYYTPSPDGRYVAYGTSPGGSENATMRIIDTTSGQDTGEVIDRAEFGEALSWLPDNHSFVFTRLQKIPPGGSPMMKYLNSRVYLHVVGDDPEKDLAIFGAGVSPEVSTVPTDIPFVGTEPGSANAFGVLAHGVQREVTAYVTQVSSLGKTGAVWRKFCDVGDDVTDAAIHGDQLFLLTHKGAPRFQVVRTSGSHPDLIHAEVVVPPSEAVVTDLHSAGDALYVHTLDGGIGRLLRVPYTSGAAAQVSLPFDGTVDVFQGDSNVPGVLFVMTSWVKGVRIYAYDPQTGKVTNTGLRPAGPFDNPEDLTSEEVKVPSYDGTLVPLSIVHKKTMALDGSNPVLMRGYGAYGITQDPAFDPVFLAWLERGGVVAVAHVRGGGEYGEDWHKWGMKLTKPNTWRDFIACGEYLIAKKYTTSARLAILGGSAGGITVGRSITERPDLFAAAIDAVPASDLLRFEQSPNGPPNVPEFGSVKTQAGFEDLYAMSSYHHVRDGVGYPAVMVTTGFNDPRVDSWEPGKMAARLQAATSSGKSVLLRVDFEAGHGFGSTKAQREGELADEFSFMLWQFGDPQFQLAPLVRPSVRGGAESSLWEAWKGGHRTAAR